MAWLIEGKPEVKPQIPAGLPHVCVCVPHWGEVSLEWVQSTYGPLSFLARADFAKSQKIARGVLNLDTERNLIAKMALEDKTVTHLLWLDTDVICESPTDPNQALSMLLQCNVPVVSGLYRAKKSKGEYPYAMWMKNPGGIGYLGLQSWTGNFIKVDAIGFGFVLVRREVFEKVPEPWFVWDKQYPSEDFDFCEKINRHGFEIKVFTDVKLSHVGLMKVRTDGAVHVLDV